MLYIISDIKKYFLVLLRDYSKILYDLVTLNIISLLSNLIPKYGIITRCYRKIKSKIKGQ